MAAPDVSTTTVPNSIIVTIDITEGSPLPCILYYVVMYKRSSDVNWLQLYPNPNTTPIEITNLIEDLVYNIRVQAQCCNGALSDIAEFDVTTTPA